MRHAAVLIAAVLLSNVLVAQAGAPPEKAPQPAPTGNDVLPFDVPQIVDETGDTMTGPLTLEADLIIGDGRAIQLSGGALEADSGLTFDGQDVCLAHRGIEGCFGGDMTGVAAGAGLLGGATSGDAVLSIDSSYTQRRLTGPCMPGFALREVAEDGTTTCEDTGTVESVTAGSGLTGGTITRSGTIGIAEGGVTSAMIADGTVGAADINTAAVPTLGGLQVTGGVEIATTSGNVGIGSTDPAAKLDVAGASIFREELRLQEASPRLVFHPTEGPKIFDLIVDESVAPADRLVLRAGDASSSTTIATFRQDGNVGIGTTNPGAQLDVLAPEGTDQPLLRLLRGGGGANGGQVEITGSDDAGNGGGKIVAPADGAGLAFATRKAGAAPTTKMVVLGDGNVGIGTTTPAARLDVRGSIAGEEQLVLSAEGLRRLALVADAGTARLNSENGADLAFGDGDVGEHVRIVGATGRVGIGTASPGAELDVAGEVQAQGLTCPACIDTADVADAVVTDAKIAFNYAASTSKGGPATDVACSACVQAADISSGAVDSAKVDFNYAASASKGGAADDVSCLGCVVSGEVLDGTITTDDLADDAVSIGKVSFNYAVSGTKGGAATDVGCAGCVDSADLASEAVDSGKVSFNYAASTSKGGAATDVACSDCIQGSDIANGAVDSTKVDFNYAASTSKGGAATDVACASCISTPDLADAAVSDAKIDFNYAGSLTKGGAASDLACAGCVGTADVADGALDSPKVSFNYAASTSKGGAATDVACTDCVQIADIAAGAVDSTKVDFNYAASTSKGGAASDVACMACVNTADLADSAVDAVKAAFNYAGSTSKGGPATDVACTDCVQTADIAGSAVDSTKVDFNYAASTTKGGAATDVVCTGCIGAVDILDGQVGTADIFDGAVATSDIATGAVTTALIADGTIQVGDLAYDPASQTELDAHKSSADHDARYYTEGEADSRFVNDGEAAGGDLTGTYPSPTLKDSAKSGFAKMIANGGKVMEFTFGDSGQFVGLETSSQTGGWLAGPSIRSGLDGGSDGGKSTYLPSGTKVHVTFTWMTRTTPTYASAFSPFRGLVNLQFNGPGSSEPWDVELWTPTACGDEFTHAYDFTDGGIENIELIFTVKGNSGVDRLFDVELRRNGTTVLSKANCIDSSGDSPFIEGIGGTVNPGGDMRAWPLGPAFVQITLP